MNYRLLAREEWPRLAELVEERFLPSPEVATVAVAENEDGVIEGMLMLQLQLHMEPLVILNPAVSFMRLHAVLDGALAERKGVCYFAFTADDKVARMAELVGMEPTPYRVWKREVV